MKLASLCTLLAAAFLAAGCQTTSIRSAWFDTDFAGPAFRKVVVTADFAATAESRLFEDTFVQKLRAAGVDAVAGHTVQLVGEGTSDASFVAGVAKTGAQGLLFVRLLGVDTRTQATTTMVPGGVAWGRGGFGSMRMTSVPVQQVTQYELATLDTKMFDVKTRQVVWAATTTTANPRSIERELPAFADLVIGELRARGVIGGK
jgi:hypothetical protein